MASKSKWRARAKKAEARVAGLEKRYDELYELMRQAEDVGVDEGLFDEDERMTKRHDYATMPPPPGTTA